MIVQIATIVLVAFVAASTGDNVEGYTAAWNADESTYKYEIPKTFKNALNNGWTKIADDELEPGYSAVAYEGDPTVILLFKDGILGGVQYAFAVADVENSGQPMEYSIDAAIIKKTIMDTDYYTASVFFTDDGSGTHTLRFKNQNGYTDIPSKVSDISANTDFVQKSCIPNMGYHHYNWLPTSDCATLYPWAVLSDGEKLTGFAFEGTGNITKIAERTWWESFPPYAILSAISDPPSCFVNGVEEHGIVALHFWLVEHSSNITCE